MPYLHFEHSSRQAALRETIRRTQKTYERGKAVQVATGHPTLGLKLDREASSEAEKKDTFPPVDSSDESETWPSSSDAESPTDAQRPASVITSSSVSEDNTSEGSLIKAYLHHRPPLHVRRSLDQFYYLSLKEADIRARDRDQVVYNFAKRKLIEQKENVDTHDHPIVMVDQLVSIDRLLKFVVHLLLRHVLLLSCTPNTPQKSLVCSLLVAPLLLRQPEIGNY